MRNPSMVTLLLVLFGLVPIGAWLAMAHNIEPVGLGRSIGIATLVLSSPLPVGGVLMLAGAGSLARARRLGRILATIGGAIVSAGAMILAVLWMQSFASCGPLGACMPELLEAIGGAAYSLAHAALIVLIWRAPRSGSDGLVSEVPPMPRG